MHPSVVVEQNGGRISIRVPTGVQAGEPVVFSVSDEETNMDVLVGSGGSVTVVTVVPATVQRARIVQRGSVEQRASLCWFNATMGKNVEQFLTSQITGEDGLSTIDWIFLATADERQRLDTANVFLSPRGRGEITVKGIAEGKARAVCNGMIRIGSDGGGTSTYLTQRVLMLDPTAEVNAVPGLEIKTNDVRASHSASIARVTEEDLFYFAARGIERSHARNMFIRGFLGDLVERIPDAPARREVLRVMEEKLGQGK